MPQKFGQEAATLEQNENGYDLTLDCKESKWSSEFKLSYEVFTIWEKDC